MNASRIGALVLAVLVTGAVPSPVKVYNLAGQLVDPLRSSPPAKAVVLLFVGTECPYSNRVAPEIRRVMAAFEPRGVRFWLVYPNPSDTPALIQAHLTAFHYHDIALRDPGHALVKMARPSVTPEAAVFNENGAMQYRGRIDDRFVELGRERTVPTEHDLEAALIATLAGRPAVPPSTQAFGCVIADLR